MNRQIEFRGRDLDGKMRYGFYAKDYGYPYIIENHTWHEVEADTVAQLIATYRNGYDVYNVYEGDPIRLADGSRCTATFRHFGAIVDGDATLITVEAASND